jgi:uncharacterized cupin superfamily protein
MNSVQSGTKELQQEMNDVQSSARIDDSIQFIDASAVKLDPCPIASAWVLEGNPNARIKVISTSADGTAMTIMWDCTAGKFNWFYNVEETVYILQGSVTLRDKNGSRLLAAGELIFFPAGSSAEWTVDSYIKKVAFLRAPLPGALASLRRILVRAKRFMRGGPKPGGLGEMFGGA